MAKDFDIAIYVAQTEDGKWVAATAASPYFCFTTDSEEEALLLAKRALDLYRRSPEPAIKGQVEAISSSAKIMHEQDLAACA